MTSQFDYVTNEAVECRQTSAPIQPAWYTIPVKQGKSHILPHPAWCTTARIPVQQTRLTGVQSQLDQYLTQPDWYTIPLNPVYQTDLTSVLSYPDWYTTPASLVYHTTQTCAVDNPDQRVVLVRLVHYSIQPGVPHYPHLCRIQACLGYGPSQIGKSLQLDQCIKPVSLV